MKLQVKPYLLYKPNLEVSQVSPDPNAVFCLFDRVVVARQYHSIPLGLKGTVIGIHHIKDPNPVRQEHLKASDLFLDVLFDEKFDQGTSIHGVAEKMIYRVSQMALINITFGAADKTQNKILPKVESKPPEVSAWQQPLTIGGKSNATNVIVSQRGGDRNNINNGNPGSSGGRKIKSNQPTPPHPTQILQNSNKGISKNSILNLSKSNFEHLLTNSSSASPSSVGVLQQQPLPQSNVLKDFIAGNANSSNSSDLSRSKGNDEISTQNFDFKTFALRQMLGITAGKKVDSVAADVPSVQSPRLISHPHSIIKQQKIPTTLPIKPTNTVIPNKDTGNQALNVLSVDEFFSMHKNSPNKPSAVNLPQPPKNWRKGNFTDVNQIENRGQQLLSTQQQKVLTPHQQQQQIQELMEREEKNKLQQKQRKELLQQQKQQQKKIGHPPGQPMNPPPAMHQKSVFPEGAHEHGVNVMHHPLAMVKQYCAPQLVVNHEEKIDIKQGYRPNQMLEQIVRPNGPQNLSNNSMNPAGHGAFIPLQAERNSYKNKQIQQKQQRYVPQTQINNSSYNESQQRGVVVVDSQSKQTDNKRNLVAGTGSAGAVGDSNINSGGQTVSGFIKLKILVKLKILLSF